MVEVNRSRVFAWGCTALIGCILGGWLGSERQATQDLYFAKVPEVPPTISLTESLFDPQSRFIESTSGLQRVSERDGTTETVSLKFYCPNESLGWGELILKWNWDAEWVPATGILEPNMLVVPAFDPSSVAEIYVSSESTGDRWLQLARLEKGLESIELNRAIDVTKWVQKGNYLRVKYRLRAEKLMTHPTPDDPIGFAGAQCLRQLKRKPFASRLLLWR
jgi:hypothetical protein